MLLIGTKSLLFCDVFQYDFLEFNKIQKRGQYAENEHGNTKSKASDISWYFNPEKEGIETTHDVEHKFLTR